MLPPYNQLHYERRLNPRRNDQEREHDGEVPPEGMLYMESKERAFLAPHSTNDRHAEPQAVRGCDKKGRELEYTMWQYLQYRLRISHYPGCLTVHHTQDKPVGAHRKYRDDSDEDT